MRNLYIAIPIGLLAILFGGCAFDLVHVKQIPVQIESIASPLNSFELTDEVDVSLGTGYSRKLKKGTKWNYCGKITYGNVYKTKDQIVTVEASNIHEAYIVVDSQQLVGFYLPVERSFSPLNDKKSLSTKEIQ